MALDRVQGGVTGNNFFRKHMQPSVMDHGDHILSEICKKCAECCKNYPFVRLTQNEINALGKLTGLSSDVFTNRKDEAGEEYFLQFKENGDCFFLNENNGDYSCGVYEARSEICKNYPSRPGQNEACEANKEMMLRNKSG